MEQTPMAQNPGPQGRGNGGKIAGIIIAILILLAIGWFVMSKKGSNETAIKSDNQQAGQQQTASNNNQPMSLKDLMMGGSQKCDVSFQDQNAQSQGTVY